MNNRLAVCLLTLLVASGCGKFDPIGASRSARPPGPPVSFQTPYCSLKYPSTWKVDTADPDYDPGSYFAIDGSPDTAFIGVVAQDDSTPDEVLVRMDEHFSGMLDVSGKGEFNSFAGINGAGIVIRGDLGSQQLASGEASFHVFVFAHKGRTHSILYSTVSSEKQMHEDLKLIEASFKMKE